MECNLTLTHRDESNSLEYKSGIDFDALEQHFIKLQKAHREQRIVHRKRSVITPESN